MDGRAIFIELRNILADLYLAPADAQRIAADAGLDLVQISFDAKAINNWHNILTVAIHSGALDDLLDQVLSEYRQYQPLVYLYERYRHFIATGGQVAPPPPLSDYNALATQGAAIGRDQIILGDQVGDDKFSGDKVMGDKHEHHHHYSQPSASKVRRPLPLVPAPPPDYIQRRQEFTRLSNYLLADNKQTVAITATIRGAGGFGKTTLAQAICHDERIRAAFPDGILWTTVGDEKANVLLGLRKLYQALTGTEAQFVDQEDATSQLSTLLSDRCCLIVIDDVWNPAHLQPFLEGGERCARLVTTRITSVIPKAAKVVALDAMQVSEATALLGAGLADANGTALTILARRLGEWPLLLKLVNRRLYEDIEQYGLHFTAAIGAVHEELNEFGLVAFDVADAAERSQAVAASIGVSLKRLKSDAQYGHILVDEVARFRELAIFPEDTPIPLHTLALLWQQRANLSFAATERLCRRLADLALILAYDLQAQTILLHDVTRHYLLSQAAAAQLVGWHSALLDGYRLQCDGEWWRLPDDEYIYQYLLWHLQEAQQHEVLEKLLFTYHWLDAKLQTTDIVSLIRDFDWRSDKAQQSHLSLLRHALQMPVSVLAQDKDQLVSQLYGRLNSLGQQWEPLIYEIANQKRVRWLQTKSPDLIHPGGNLLYTLSGHMAGVSNLVLTPDGRLISACGFGNSSDYSVKVWDIEAGVLLHSLKGHTAGVSHLLLTPDGHLISACGNLRLSDSSDTSVKVWDIETGVLLHSLEGHTAEVSKLLLTPNGRLISACNNFSSGRDYSVKVWDIETGVLLHSLEGHTAGVSSLLLTLDGHLISACGFSNGRDTSVKVWDIETGVLLHSLDGHTYGVSSLLLTPNGRLISACGFGDSSDYSVKVWDIETGVLLHSLEGHTAGVSELLLTPDGRLLSACSGSRDYSVKVWDIETGVLLHSLDGHTAGVSHLLLTPNGRLISACATFSSGRDYSVKVWDIETVVLHSLEGHMAEVTNLLLTPDGRLLSACGFRQGRDYSVKVWDIETGMLLHSLEGHTAEVSKLLLTPNGRLISACGFGDRRDYSVKVWDIETGVLLHSLEGHMAGVSKLLLTPDGHLIFACGFGSDYSVEVWDIEAGVLLHSLEGHTAGVSKLLLTPNGRLISACGMFGSSRDTSVKVWDIETGVLLHSLERHTSYIQHMILSCWSDCFITAGECQINVWNWDSGEKVAGFTTDGAIGSLTQAADGTIVAGDGLGCVHFLRLVEP